MFFRHIKWYPYETGSSLLVLLSHSKSRLLVTFCVVYNFVSMELQNVRLSFTNDSDRSEKWRFDPQKSANLSQSLHFASSFICLALKLKLVADTLSYVLQKWCEFFYVRENNCLIPHVTHKMFLRILLQINCVYVVFIRLRAHFLTNISS